MKHTKRVLALAAALALALTLALPAMAAVDLEDLVAQPTQVNLPAPHPPNPPFFMAGSLFCLHRP